MRIRFELNPSDFTLEGWRKIQNHFAKYAGDYSSCKEGCIIRYNDMNPYTNQEIVKLLECKAFWHIVVYPIQGHFTWMTHVSNLYFYSEDVMKIYDITLYDTTQTF